jgi:transposase
LQRESCGCSLGSMQRHDHSPETWLDEADRKRLAAALAGAREARVYRRLEALLLVAEGHSMAEAARRCRVNRSSVHRWLAQYRAEHEASALLDRPRSGRPRLHRPLTPQRLAAALARDPRRCGYQATSWTVPLLAHDLSAKGIAVSPRTLRRRLHEAGYRWKRPRYVYVARAPHLAQKKGGSPDV